MPDSQSRAPDRPEARGVPVDHRELGRRGEDLATRLLMRAGYRIVARNWRSGRYEIDVVAIRDEEVVFAEVKTRRPGPQSAAESVTAAQRRRLVRGASAWMRRNPDVGRSFRFDIIAVGWPEDAAPILTHIPGAFDAAGP